MYQTLVWKPKSQWEARVARTLHGSVLAMFDKPGASLAVADVAVRVARATSGPAGALLAALYCYIVPVQVSGIDAKEMVRLVIENESNDVSERGVTMNQEVSQAKERRGGQTTQAQGGRGGAQPRDPSVLDGEQTETIRKDYAQRTSFSGAKRKKANRVRGGVQPGNSLVQTTVASLLYKDTYGASGSYEPETVGMMESDHAQLASATRGFTGFDTESSSAMSNLFGSVLSKVRADFGGLDDEVGTARHGLVRLGAARSAVGVRKGCDIGWQLLVKKLEKLRSPVAKAAVLMDGMVDGTIPDTWVAPLKTNPASRTKVNLRLCDVLSDVFKYYNSVWYDLACVFQNLAGCHNDEVTGWVIWYVACWNVDKELANLIMSIRRKGSLVKDISTMAKSLGLNATQEGSMVCELNTLIGRGAVMGSADLDVKTRVDKKAFYEQKAAVIDKDKLRTAIRAVLREEKAREPVWQDVEDYWSKRWLYTKSGSHTRHIEDVMYGERLDLPEQPTRREFAEAVTEPIIAKGFPSVYAGLSWKLEHGKTRAIYGCDSRSYFTYDYLLGPVEAVWRNKSTLLNPGSRPQAELYEDLSKRGPYYYMLDFDDYNSQHELEAMKMVIEEACVGAPPEVLDWAVRSWDNMFVRWVSDASGKLEKKRMVGTLPSGHRATTFVNTILNAAYCRVVIGDAYKDLGMLHAGDDVIAWGTSEHISSAIARVEESPLRVNRSKQSAGSESGEFLRVAFNKKNAFGYTARAVASAVSGNWVTEAEVAPRSYVDNFTRLAWTLANRSGVRNIGALLKTSLTRRVPNLSGQAYDLCTNRVSLGGAPIMTDTPTQWTKIALEGGSEKRERVDEGVSSHATDDYLHKHIDFKLLKEAGVNPGSLRAMMLKASYKPRGERVIQSLAAREIKCPPTVVQGLTTVAFFKKREVTEHSATKILESLIGGVDWRVLVARLRGTDSSYLSVTGKSEWPVGGPRGMAYADCVGLRKMLTRPTLVRTVYKVYA